MSDGNTAPWYGELAADAPQDFKDWVGAKGFKDPVSALQSSFNLEKLLGADRAGRTVVLPKDDNDADGIKAFRSKIGVPDKAADYQLPVPEGGDAKFAETAAAWFQKNGIPASAARAFWTEQNNHLTEQIRNATAAAEAESQKQLDAVRQEWGGSFDANAEIARRYVKASGLNEEQIGAVEEALGTAVFLKTFHGLGKSLGEQGFTGDPNGGGGGGRELVRQQLEDLRSQRAEGKISAEDFFQRSEQLQKRLAA